MAVISTDSSEDVAALSVDVAEIVDRRRVHHRLSIRHSAPDVSLHVLAVLDWVLLALLNVLVFRRAAVTSNRLIVACVQRVTLFERSEEGLRFGVGFLLREGNVGAIGSEVRVEAAALAHRVGPGLIAVDDLRVLIGVLSPRHVLLALVRIF